MMTSYSYTMEARGGFSGGSRSFSAPRVSVPRISSPSVPRVVSPSAPRVSAPRVSSPPAAVSTPSAPRVSAPAVGSRVGNSPVSSAPRVSTPQSTPRQYTVVNNHYYSPRGTGYGYYYHPGYGYYPDTFFYHYFWWSMFWNASQQPQQVIVQQQAVPQASYGPPNQFQNGSSPQEQVMQPVPQPQDDTNFLGLTTVGILIGLCILGYLAYRGTRTAS